MTKIGTQTASEALPRHLIGFESSSWLLWRWFGVRGAGFPIAQTLALAQPATAQIADCLFQAEEASVDAAADLNHLLNQELEKASATGTDPRALLKLRKKLKKGQLPPPSPQYGDLILTALQINASLQEQRGFLEKEYQAAYAREQQASSKLIHELAREERLREAVTWQNRQALERGFGSLLRREPGTVLSRQRQNEDLVVNYLQRYCTKNETIGFFGPVGWGWVGDGGEGITARPEQTLLCSRRVYFENWGIEALARKFSSQQLVKPWLKPRRAAYVRVEAGKLYEPMEAAQDLSRLEERLLTMSRGIETAKALMEEVISEGVASKETEVYECLEKLCRRRWLIWEIEIGMTQYPEKELRRNLESVEDEDIRSACLEELSELECLRDEVSKAAGDAERLNSALLRIEEGFTRLTGKESTRSSGRAYAGRTLVYEDCRRGLDVRLGQDVRERLGRPLGLLLESARWLTQEVSRRYRQEFERLYERLSEGGAKEYVEGVEFWYGAQRVIFGERSPVMDATREMQERWERLLGGQKGDKEVRYESGELQEAVSREFGEGRPGWSSARYHSPDVMIGREGEGYEFVMGELHLGVNTLGAGLFVQQHPAMQSLFEAVSHDLPSCRIFPAYAKHRQGTNPRTGIALYTINDYCLESSLDSSLLPGATPIPLASFVIKRNHGQQLVACSRDGKIVFDIIEFFGEILSAVTSNGFKLLQPTAHRPRVYIDDLVVWRESWAVPVKGFDFLTGLTEPGAKYLEMRRWAHREGMPRFVFVKAPIEVKPFYVDFDSPVSVRLFEKVIRKMQEMEKGVLQITEMLPRPDQAWLPDAEGLHYTSEFRFVVLDPQQPGTQSVSAD